MITVSSNHAKQAFGRILESAQREPVVIEKHKRPSVVMLSIVEYDRLRGLNLAEFGAFCDAIGQRAAQLGMNEETLNALLDEE
jgi:prevent-host-death family protein